MSAWHQPINPLHHLALSAIPAALPILFIFWALMIKKMKGHQACLWATAIILVDAVVVYGMPVKLASLSVLNGVFYGLFPICWIVVMVIWLFNMTVRSGRFEVIKYSMAAITSDRRLQALLIAFSFSSFLEGTAGFGAPVAISAAMLVGLGFDAFYAAAVSLLGNTIPSIFAAIGIPVTVISEVSGIPAQDVTQALGELLPIMTLLIPCFIVFFMAGFKKTMAVWPALLVSGGSYTLLQWMTTTSLGSSLPAIIAGLGSVVALTIFLKFWSPKEEWHFLREQASKKTTTRSYTALEVFRAWSPFLLLSTMIVIWGLTPVKKSLHAIGDLHFAIPGLHHHIQTPDGALISHIFHFNYLSGAGTAILISSFITIVITGLTFKQGIVVFKDTVKQMTYPIILITSILGFAHVANDSGMTMTIAAALAGTGFLYSFFAPVLGWLGVFISGSNTTASALFGKLQSSTAHTIGVSAPTMVAANMMGGTAGKIVSPQSIAIGAAAVDLVGYESKLLRHVVAYSLILLGLSCGMTFIDVYLSEKAFPKNSIEHREDHKSQAYHTSSTAVYGRRTNRHAQSLLFPYLTVDNRRRW